MKPLHFPVLVVVLALITSLSTPFTVVADDADLKKAVNNAIKRAQDFLLDEQQGDGSWSIGDARYPSGPTSVVLLALLNSGLTAEHPDIQRGLKHLRRAPAPKHTYEIALMIMVYAAAKDGGNDLGAIQRLSAVLEESQIKIGPNAGIWSYGGGRAGFAGGDRSNGQFAVLGLRDAVNAGAKVDRVTWERVRKHWSENQNPDGGWGYTTTDERSTGSMTAAGIATLAICDQMLRDAKDDTDADGKPNCCSPDREPNTELANGIRWLESRFTVRANPGKSSEQWVLYYLYGVERAGRLNRMRFFGEYDWYREGARFLVSKQRIRGDWHGNGDNIQQNPGLATGFSLLFLAKGLSPVLINKLEYGPADPADKVGVLGTDWNNHPDDAANLTDFLTFRPKWPKLMTSQVVKMRKLQPQTAVEELKQAKIVLITGRERPEFTEEQITWLRQYVDQGGFIFGVRNCESVEFDAGFRDLVARLFPDGDAELKRLEADHPVFRSEFLFSNPESIDLWGVDFGCRTSIMYSPVDLSCFWDKWSKQPPPGRTAQIASLINRNMRIGVNVVAYATGREPPQKLDVEGDPTKEGTQDQIERGLLRIAKLRHEGGWDTAPGALRNLLHSLNQKVGLTASTEKRDLPLSDPAIKSYPILYMHGRNGFNIGRAQAQLLRKHLDNGAVLFADACCGSSQFDRSFRNFLRDLYPDNELKQIPADHELFDMRGGLGHHIPEATRRVPQIGGEGTTFEAVEQKGPPFLEGIEIDGRYPVIYSKYDISCALERQSTVACAGYISKDAVRIAVNVVLYAMLQDVAWRDTLEHFESGATNAKF